MPWAAEAFTKYGKTNPLQTPSDTRSLQHFLPSVSQGTGTYGATTQPDTGITGARARQYLQGSTRIATSDGFLKIWFAVIVLLGKGFVEQGIKFARQRGMDSLCVPTNMRRHFRSDGALSCHSQAPFRLQSDEIREAQSTNSQALHCSLRTSAHLDV